MMSTKGYGLFFHTPFATEWNMGCGIVVIIIHSKLLAVIWTIILFMVPIFYTMVDRYTELTGKSPHASSFCNGVACRYLFGGTWKNEEMTSDKYPPALCKRLREEGVPF